MLPGEITSANYGKDGGDFLAAALTGGVPHPTGYPTYILILRFFLGMPFGNDYFKGSLLSALAASLAVFLLSTLIAHRNKWSRAGLIGALAGGMALAFSPLFWSQAVIVEVQALQAFFICLSIWWITLLEEAGYSTLKKTGLLFIACGMGVSIGNHITIIFIFPWLVLAARKAYLNGLAGRWLAGQAIALAVGCLVYLYLPIAAQRYPPVNWGNPQSPEGFWWLISGSPYQNMLFGVSGPKILDRLGVLAKLLVEQFLLPGLLAAAAGIFLSNVNSKLFHLGLIYMFTAYCVFFVSYNSNDAIVYLIASWIAFSAWIGMGISWVWEKRFHSIPWGAGVSALLLAALLLRIPLGWSSVDPKNDTTTQQYLEIITQKAPPGALMLTVADADTFPLWYRVLGEKIRDDLRIIVLPLTQYPWYQDTLRHAYLDLKYPPEEANLAWGDKLVELNPGHPVCRSENPTGDLEKIKITCDGIELLNLDFSQKGY